MTAEAQPQAKKRSGTVELWARYWAAYGGWSELLKSHYFVAAAIVTLVSAGSWIHRGWWDVVISVLPNVLGFTLGGYAILLSFGDEKFRAMLAATKADALDHGSSTTKPSPYRELSASFLHFIVVQTLALVFALVAKSAEPIDQLLRRRIGADFTQVLEASELVASCLGYLVFIYALFAALAASFYVFRLSTWFELFASTPNEPPPTLPSATKLGTSDATKENSEAK